MNESIKKLEIDNDKREASYKNIEPVPCTPRIDAICFIDEKIECSEDSFVFVEDIYEEYKNYALNEKGLNPIPYLTFCKFLNDYDFESSLVTKGTKTKNGRQLTCYYGIRIK